MIRTNDDPGVSFSVVIPTFHRNDRLSLCLDQLAPGRQPGMTVATAGDQRQPGQGGRNTYEVIVSDAGLETTAEQLLRTRYPWARWAPSPGSGPAANRNNGATVARGEWVAFIDDDCQPTPGWLSALSEAAADGADVIEGQMVAPDKSDNILRHPVDNLHGGVYWSGNLAIRRSIFDRLGRFDEDFHEACCEDLELADRIRHSGVRTTFARAATVLHPCHIVTPCYLFRRTFLIRWHLLYLHKTGQTVAPNAPVWKALSHLAWYRLRGLLSVTRRLRRLYPGRPRSAAFNLIMQWTMFPIVLPYLMYWELRFRRMLLARAGRDVSFL